MAFVPAGLDGFGMAPPSEEEQSRAAKSKRVSKNTVSVSYSETQVLRPPSIRYARGNPSAWPFLKKIPDPFTVRDEDLLILSTRNH